MKKQGLRDKFFIWILKDLIKYDEGKMLNLPLRILWAMLFPIKALHYSVEQKEGYQWVSNSWIIHGIRYSDELFRHFAYGDDCLYKIIKREDGLITIERQAKKSK